MRIRGVAGLGLAVALVASMSQATDLRAPSGVACTTPTFVASLGNVCPTPFGYQVLLEDGSWVYTHGADATPIGLDTLPVGAPLRRMPACVSDPKQFHAVVIYGYAADRPNRLTKKIDEIRRTIKEMNWFLHFEAKARGGSADYRVRCTGGEIYVRAVRLDTPFRSTNFGSVVGDLRGQGFTSPYEKYWTWFDGFPQGNAPGVASMMVDDSLSSQNGNNIGSQYAIAFKPGQFKDTVWSTLMHEAGHTLGAVQGPSSPNGSGPPNGQGGGMHCNDGPDIMCYPDNGSRSDYHANVCSRLHWDCNFDDYFNVTPKPRSYLATHWNLGSPLNRFFAGCGYHTGDLSVGTLSGVTGQDPDALVKAQAGDWAPIATRTYSVPKSCRGRPFAVSGFPRIPSQVDHQDDPTGQLIQGFVINNFWPGLPELPVPDYNVCFYKGSRQLRCAIETGDDTGKVPTSATRVRVLFNGGPPGIFVLNMM